MNWYLAKLVYRIICSDVDNRSEFDEQLRLLFAEDELHAFQKARLLGDKETYSQTGLEETLIEWKFIDVSELHKIDIGTDGAEMYSHISIQDNPDVYIRNTHKRALHLFDHAVEHFTES
jgi:hypothetical protein